MKRDGTFSYLAEIIIFLIIILVYASAFLAVRNKSANLPATDVSILYYDDAIILYDRFRSEGIKGLGQTTFYMPGYLALTAAVLALLNMNCMLTTLVMNLFSLTLLLFSAYLLGRKISDRLTAIAICATAALCPVIYLHFPAYFLDFPVLWALVLSAFMLLMSDYFMELKWSLLLSAACAAGSMINFTFGVYAAGIILSGLIIAVNDARKKDYRRLLNFGLFFIFLAALIGPYHSDPDRIKLIFSQPFIEADSAPWYYPRIIRIFLSGLWDTQLSPPIFFLVLYGVCILIKKKDKRLFLLLSMWILLPHLILVPMPHWKAARYLMPLMPAYAVFGGIGARSLLREKTGAALFSMILALGIFQYYDFSRGENSVLTARSEGRIRYFINRFYPEMLWQKEGPQNVLFERVKEEIRRIGKSRTEKRIPVILIDNYAWNGFNFLANHQFRLLLRFHNIDGIEVIAANDSENIDFRELLFNNIDGKKVRLIIDVTLEEDAYYESDIPSFMNPEYFNRGRSEKRAVQTRNQNFKITGPLPEEYQKRFTRLVGKKETVIKQMKAQKYLRADIYTLK